MDFRKCGNAKAKSSVRKIRKKGAKENENSGTFFSVPESRG
jgi:hypothetical protein